MRQIVDFEQEMQLASNMVEITGAFEGIASTRITSIKDQVLKSTAFFGDLWRIYSQLRVGATFHFGRGRGKAAVTAKELMILITSEGSFSGDIDEKLIGRALSDFDPLKKDIIVVGHHGLVQLTQKRAPIVKAFAMPHKDKNFNILPLVAEVQKYTSTTVYYQQYASLMNQEIKTIELSLALAEKGSQVRADEEIISERDYIFEPSTFAVVNHLESSMMQVMLSEVILESKLAQYASRFRAMRVSHDKAEDKFKGANWQYRRAKRQLKDERLREVVNGLRRRRVK